MSQNFSQLISGTTKFSELYGRINNNIEAVRSQWSGTTPPADPVQGQPFLNTSTNRLYIWSGTVWLDATNYLPAFTAIASEVTAARGVTASIGARLGVSINDDGTLKSPAPAGGWWATEADAVTYNAADSFIVAGDKLAIYTARRAVHLVQTASVNGHVVSATFDGGQNQTTVTVDCAVDVGLMGVEYGQPVSNEPNITSLNNATLTNTSINQSELKDYSETKSSPSSASGALTLNIANGNVFEVTLTENVTTLTISNPSPAGKACSVTLILHQGTTARTVAWGAVKWSNGTSPNISTVSATYILTLMTVDGGAIWYGFLAGAEMS